MRTYIVTFPFKGNYHFVSFTDEMLANSVMTASDEAYYDLLFVNDNAYQNGGENHGFFCEKIYDGGYYTVEFNLKNPHAFNIYESEEENYLIVEENVPWCLLKVKDENKEAIYNISDNL